MILANIFFQTEGLCDVLNILNIKGGSHGNCEEKNSSKKNSSEETGSQKNSGKETGSKEKVALNLSPLVMNGKAVFLFIMPSRFLFFGMNSNWHIW